MRLHTVINRLDTPRSPVTPPERPAQAPRPAVNEAVAQRLPPDAFEASAPGAVPLGHRIFAKSMVKFEGQSTATAKLTLGADLDLEKVQLDLNLKHAAPGDLVVTLTSPGGKTHVLSDREPGDGPDVRGRYDLSGVFGGEHGRGEWTLTVENKGPRGDGLIDSWTLEVSGTTRARPVPTGEPVAISELAERYGWKAGEWQTGLLQAADKKAGADGKVTAAELDAYLAAPDDLRFLTSSAMQVQRKALEAAGGEKAVSSFDAGWQRELATRADANRDGRLGGHELNDYLTTVKAGSASAETLWMPDQKAAPFASRIADHTGEADLLTTGGLPDESLLLTKNYMRVSANVTHRGPNWSAYELSAADVLERPPGVTRPAHFPMDPELGDASANDADYNNHGWDRGHNKPARDSANQESMDESFLLSNIAPQAPSLNQKAWELLEQGTWELTQAVGGKSTIFTGGLFLDENGKPLPEDQKQWVGRDGEDRVAIPTHFFKAALVRMPDGTQKSFAYVIPNRDDLQMDDVNEQAALLREGRVSVDRLEELLGEDLFGAVADDVEAGVEKDAAPLFQFADRERFRVANLLWPADGKPPFIDPSVPLPRADE